MKKLFLLLIMFVALQSSAQAYCLRTGSGLVWVGGNRRATTFYLGRGHSVTVACSLARAGYIYWRAMTVCPGYTIYGWDSRRRPFYCRVTRVR